MTVDIAIIFGVLAVMAFFFFTEKLPIDLTAFLGLIFLTLAGYLTPQEAFTGFSSPAVITMLSIFIVSGALHHTGVADVAGERIHSVVGNRETTLVIIVMLVAGLLSAFMNNIAATAVLMPAVASIGRKSGVPASRLFMPLAFGAILGGTTTLVGTPPNILASELLQERGLQTFGLFDYTPLGLVLLGTGILFMVTLGKRLLPGGVPSDSSASGRDLVDLYQIQSRLFSLCLPERSEMDGKTLGEMRLGSTLRVQVLMILREDQRLMAPRADTVLRSRDVLVVEGSLKDLQDLVQVRGVEVEQLRIGDLRRPRRGVSGAKIQVVAGSALTGRTLRELQFREAYGLVALGIVRGDKVLRGRPGSVPLQEGDEILALGTRAALDALRASADLAVKETGLSAVKQLQDHVFLVKIPEDSPLVGTKVGAGRLGELVDVTLAGIVRKDETRLAVGPDEVIQAHDRLMVTGEASRVLEVLELGEVEIDPEAREPSIEAEDLIVVEATLSPRSSIAGKTFAELHFRQRYGVEGLGIWREGESLRGNLANRTLRLGDAFLMRGSWERFAMLAEDPDFVVLHQPSQPPARTGKAPAAVGGLLLMVAMVVTGYQPIHMAAFTAAAVVLLLRTITMDEAYRAIEWRAIFLVAAVLPVGIAMERTGAALMLANAVMTVAGPMGPYAVLAALIVLSSLLSQALDGAPAVVLLTPVALQTATQLGVSTLPIMMGVSLAASAAFMTPFSHKANLLVMGAGGYRAVDYLRVGAPLTVVLLALMVALVPVFFPF